MLYQGFKSKLIRTLSRLSLAGLVLASAAVLAFVASTPRAAYAERAMPPEVPANLQVPTGHKVYQVGHAVGTQNYVCLPSATGFQFVLFTPEATLFGDNGKQVSTHFFSPNPQEANSNPRVLSDHVVRAAWQSTKDGSTVWGMVQPGHSSTDPAYVAPGAIAWLLVTVVGTQDGPNGGGQFGPTTYIQRLNTQGGLAPSTGCAAPEDVGKTAFVPYTTDYYFYKAAGSN